ncbi:MAG: hypothetical protein IJ640_01035 [Prevotella sp.]|nr:hypothetical protein [Prevotella sp.]
MTKREEQRALEISRVADKRYPIYGTLDPDNSDLNTGFVEGAEWSDRHPQNPWRVKEKDGDPDNSIQALVNLDGVYLVCDYDKDKNEWWLCDGYISGYAPNGRPLYSSKTKLKPNEVAAIRTYMQLPNEPKEDE